MERAGRAAGSSGWMTRPWRAVGMLLVGRRSSLSETQVHSAQHSYGVLKTVGDGEMSAE